MLQKLALPIAFLMITVPLISCQPAQISGNAPPQNVQNNAPPPAKTPLSAGTPCPTPSPDTNRKVVITAPCDGATVAARNFVEGTVSDSNVQVWVIIHPMETADFWVQPSVTIREGGKWKVLCYFGEPGQHSGKPFEVLAVVNPKAKLKEGELLSGWPDAASKSQVVEVVRD